MATLTESQYRELAEELRGSRKSFHLTARRLFGVEIDDDDWEGLADHANLFKCVECDTFKDLESRESPGFNCCRSCAAEIDAAEGD